MIQNLWDDLKWKFIVIQIYLRKQGKSQINNLILHLKEIEKKKTKSKVSRRNKFKEQRINKKEILENNLKYQ